MRIAEERNKKKELAVVPPRLPLLTPHPDYCEGSLWWSWCELWRYQWQYWWWFWGCQWDTMLVVKTIPIAEERKRTQITNLALIWVFLTHCFQFFLSRWAALWWQFAPFYSLSHYSLTWHHHLHLWLSKTSLALTFSTLPYCKLTWHHLPHLCRIIAVLQHSWHHYIF